MQDIERHSIYRRRKLGRIKLTTFLLYFLLLYFLVKFCDYKSKLLHDPAGWLSLPLLGLLKGIRKALVVPEDVGAARVEPVPQRLTRLLVVCEDHAGVVELVTGRDQPDRGRSCQDMSDVSLLALPPRGLVYGSRVATPRAMVATAGPNRAVSSCSVTS